jgi:hypothetical protein
LPPEVDPGPLLPARLVWQRYAITSRTLNRWLEREDLGFPLPLRVNGRRYWYEAELTGWERRTRPSAASSQHASDG